MSDRQPSLDQVNLLTDNLDAVLDFYRRLGVPVPDPGTDWPPGSGAHHVGVTLPGMSLEFDDAAMGAIWHAGVRGGSAGAGTVLGFSLPSREAVDARYAELVAAGATGRQAPYDGFWGARYAIVADPDGRDVGLMSPIDPDRKYVPDAEPGRSR
jgi:uncharacterized glyoxalase superfamily protein PhnB